MDDPFSSPMLPTQHDKETAQASGRLLAAYFRADAKTQCVEVLDAENRRHIVELPTGAVRLLIDSLAEMGKGNAVQLFSIPPEVSLQKAAEFLNVSRSAITKLLASGDLPSYESGKRRRIRFADLMTYQRQRVSQASEAMQALAKQAQKLDMGYE